MQKTILGLLLAVLPLAAQQIAFPPVFEKLALKASEKINVNLDASLVEFAGRFLSGEKADEAAAKKLLGALKGIYMRGFEFAKPGEYAPADLDSIREQLKDPAWNCIVSVREKDEETEICLHRTGDALTGLALLAAEPTELTIINIVGSIRPEDLATLGGKFGIPDLKRGAKALLEKKRTAPAAKKEE